MSTSVIGVSPQRLHAVRRQGKEIELIDVRTPAEYRAGHAAGAKLIPLNDLRPEALAVNVEHTGAGRDEPLYLICQSGARARQAAERLLKAGHHNLALVEGGT